MKKLFLLAFAAILFGTLFLSSCSKSDDTITSPNTGDAREKFHGNWNVAENSVDFGMANYYVTISDSSNASYIMFAFLYGENRKIYSTVSGNNFSIPSQIIAGKTFSGSGMLSNSNRIDMTYLVRTTAVHYDTVTAILTK